MLISVLKSKILRLKITEANLAYEGSLGLDSELMDKVGLFPNEKILVANLENGKRFETYTIAAPAGSKTVSLNGAAAHKGQVGQHLILMSFAQIDIKEASKHTPSVLILDKKGETLKTIGIEAGDTLNPKNTPRTHA